MKADFVIDNMPKNANPVYECAADATPFVFKPGKDYDGCSIAGTVIKAKKDKGTKTRYTVPLYSITDKILEQVSFVVAQMRNNGYWMNGVVMCIRGGEIGLACHDPRLKQEKSATLIKTAAAEH